MKQLTNAQFHKFDETPIFIGEYVEESKRMEDQDPKDGTGKKGDTNGYIFETEDGTLAIIGNAKAVEDAMKGKTPEEVIKPGDVIGFKFLGKRQTKKKKNFNAFQIIQFDTFEEANEYYHPTVS